MPARPCTHPGCTALSRDGSGRCEAHPKPTWLRTGFEPKRLGGSKGTARRKRWLAAHPLCEHCKPRVTLGEEVDHVIPLARGGADDESNFQTLCRPCHRVKSVNDRWGR